VLKNLDLRVGIQREVLFRSEENKESEGKWSLLVRKRRESNSLSKEISPWDQNLMREESGRLT